LPAPADEDEDEDDEEELVLELAGFSVIVTPEVCDWS
jgi:hypothetical protein